MILKLRDKLKDCPIEICKLNNVPGNLVVPWAIVRDGDNIAKFVSYDNVITVRDTLMIEGITREKLKYIDPVIVGNSFFDSFCKFPEVLLASTSSLDELRKKNKRKKK